MRDEMVDDAWEFVSGGGDRFRSAEPGLHAAKEVTKGCLAALPLQRLDRGRAAAPRAPTLRGAPESWRG